MSTVDFNHNTYAAFREAYWGWQEDIHPQIHFDACANGTRFPFPVLYPKRNLFLHDVWLLPSWGHLRTFLATVLPYPDLKSVQTHGNDTLWLDFSLPPGGTHELPDQAQRTPVN